MLPKSKTLIIFIVISLYIAHIFFAYSGDLFSQIQKIRYENQIEKIELSETITFSLEEWQAFSDKTEIKHNNAYYDVISFQKFHSEVTVKIVKDDLEDEFRFVISQLLNQHKTPSSEKKNTFVSKHLVQKDKINFDFKIDFIIDTIENHSTQFNLKTRSFIYSEYQPPC